MRIKEMFLFSFFFFNQEDWFSRTIVAIISIFPQENLNFSSPNLIFCKKKEKVIEIFSNILKIVSRYKKYIYSKIL